MGEVILYKKCGDYFVLSAAYSTPIQRKIRVNEKCPWCQQPIKDLSNNPEFVNHSPGKPLVSPEEWHNLGVLAGAELAARRRREKKK